MGQRLSIHANGGYDIVEVEGDKERIVEFDAFASCPLKLAQLAARHLSVGHEVDDYRSPEKLALARVAETAMAHAIAMVALAEVSPGVEPEAVTKAKLYALACAKIAMESEV